MRVQLISFERGKEKEKKRRSYVRKNSKDLFSLVYTCTNQLTRRGKKHFVLRIYYTV